MLKFVLVRNYLPYLCKECFITVVIFTAAKITFAIFHNLGILQVKFSSFLINGLYLETATHIVGDESVAKLPVDQDMARACTKGLQNL